MCTEMPPCFSQPPFGGFAILPASLLLLLYSLFILCPQYIFLFYFRRDRQRQQDGEKLKQAEWIQVVFHLSMVLGLHTAEGREKKIPECIKIKHRPKHLTQPPSPSLLSCPPASWCKTNSNKASWNWNKLLSASASVLVYWNLKGASEDLKPHFHRKISFRGAIHRSCRRDNQLF